ncbi:MAG: glycosyltransferase family 2 protein [Aureispira sp.]|nr:glycosyltransferase family 2 protein [Aureispira sp.]
MILAEYLFWFFMVIIVYTFVGYGILLWFLVKMQRILLPKKESSASSDIPKVTLIIAAYNELEILDQKIQNCQSLNYPEGLLEIWFITDGSTDNSEHFLQKNTNFKVFHKPKRSGKMAAINRVMPFVLSEVVVFTDANTILHTDAILNLVKPLENPKIGCVAGEKRISSSNSTTASNGEGIYWKYESKLKAWNASLYSTVGAAGELFAIRTRLYIPPPNNTILDDFLISLSVINQGYRIAYAADAFVIETGSLSLEEEMKRKIRICAGGFQAISKTSNLLNPLKHSIFAFQYFSHRFLRWAITPILLVIVFFLNLYLYQVLGGVYTILFVLQTLFYSLASLGWIRQNSTYSNKLFLIPCYFMMMNIAALIGLQRYLRQSQSVLWQPSQRITLK